MYIVEATNLVKKYGNITALDNFNLKVPSGSIFGLLGPNGAGKSTFMNIVSGFSEYDKGKVEVFNKNINSKNKEFNVRIGVVPQEIAVFEDMTVLDNLKLFCSLYGFGKVETIKRCNNIMQKLSLIEYAKRKVNTLSGGMKRRLNIACAITHDPELVIMDEPAAGLDFASRLELLQYVKQLNENGSTVIYCSHYLEEVKAICTHICIIDKGRNLLTKNMKSFIKDKRSLEEIFVCTITGTCIDN